MTALCGKGIWVLYSFHLKPAFEMAVRIGATHLLCKTGHRAMFFPGAAHHTSERVRAVGLVPFGWQVVHCDDPAGEARVALETAEAGYEGIVFDVVEEAVGREADAREMGRRLLDAGINPRVMYYSSLPAVPRKRDVPHAEMVAFCRGGYMPRCFPTLHKPAEVAIHKLTYEEHARRCQARGHSVPLYPVLAAFRDENAADRLSEVEFGHWAAALTRHRPSFVSVFHAGVTGREFWPTLSDLAVPRQQRIVVLEPTLLSAPEEAHAEASEPAALYVVTRADDTIVRLCREYGCTRDQFWEWNISVWDERGLPHDPDYMQAGWRVRVK